MMKYNNSVSVCLATYNGEKYIAKQLDSILDQQEYVKEIIICDDGSTDGTKEIIKQYRSKNPKLIDTYFNEENIGVTKNFEKAILLSEGKYIALCDQDDIWKPKKLERQMSVLTSEEAILSFHDSAIVSETSGYVGEHWDLKKYTPYSIKSNSEMLESLTSGNFIKGSTMLFRKELIPHVIPIPDNWTHDYYIGILSLIVGSVAPVEECLHVYRRHRSQSSQHMPKNIVEHLFRGIQSGLSLDDRVAEWETLDNRLEDIPFNGVEKKVAKSIIQDRISYEKARRDIYESKNKNLFNKCRKLWENIKNNRYQRFNRMNSRLFMLKDVAAIIIGYVYSLLR